MTRRLKAAIAALAVTIAATLTACGGGDPHNGEHCTHRHAEYQPPAYVKVGAVMMPIGGGYDNVCDTWAPDDAATVTNR